MDKTKRQLRAEAVERLRECRYHTLSDYVRAMLGWGHEPHFEDSRDALIDLLTDDESCNQYADLPKRCEEPARESCTNLDWLYEHDRDGLVLAMCCDNPGRADCGDCAAWKANKSCLFKREWLMAPHANDDLTHENDVSVDAVDANDGNENLGSSSGTSEDYEGKGSEVDSREKLEDDIQSDLAALSEYGKLMLDWYVVMDWLDRQAEITAEEAAEAWEDYSDSVQREIAELLEQVDKLTKQLEAVTNANDDYRNEWHRVCAERMNLRRELTAEKNKSVELAEQLGAAMAERDEWRAKVGAMLDAAQEIRRIANIG